MADKSSNVVARTYDYATEAHCDSTKDIFLHSIQTAADMPGQGFAALKVCLGPITALSMYLVHLPIQVHKAAQALSCIGTRPCCKTPTPHFGQLGDEVAAPALAQGSGSGKIQACHG